MAPTLILVSGLSCTGKSTLAQKISAEFNLPYFSKDMFKELLFDELGYSDRSWSQKLGAASYGILYLIAENLLKTNQSFVLESNFKSDIDRQDFLDLQQKFTFKIVEILCFADGQVLFDRFKNRAESGLRHPGHVDHLCYTEQRPRLLKGKTESLNLGPVIEVNTTDFSHVDYSKILNRLKQMIKSLHG